MGVSSTARTTMRRVPGLRSALAAAEGVASVRVLLASGWFDVEWYDAQTGRSSRSAAEAVSHYVGLGRRAGYSPNPLFEASWVEPKRWRSSRTDPFARFLGRAHRSDVSTHPLFDPLEWLRLHPDAVDHPRGAFGHMMETVTDSTLLPPVAELRAAGAEPVAFGVARREALGRARAWRAQEVLREAERVTDRHDARAAEAFVGRWAVADPPRSSGPVVSVVMPVFNRAITLLAAIASVQAQTLENWELVVVDDGSTDGTAEVVQEVARHDPRIILVRGEHAGVSRARNIGASHASGLYLAWLDSDNTWTPHFLRTAVAAMHAGGIRVAYAQSELVSRSGRQYRALAAGADHFEVRNHVDLNVLVAERSLVEAVGGFDEHLRRTVDYDLAWRLSRHAQLEHLPFVGVVYDDEGQDEDRITTTELFSWKEVVRSKHLVDWSALRSRQPESGLTSVVVVARTGWSEAWTTALAVLSDGCDDRLEVVLVDDALPRGAGAVLGALALAVPAAGITRLAATGLHALAWNVGFSRTRGDVVVFTDEAVRPGQGWITPLRASLAQPRTGAVQPMTVAAGGLIESAGGFFCPRGGLPLSMLNGYLAEDAERLGAVFDGHLEIAVVDAPVIAVRSRDFVEVRGFDCLYVGGWEAADLSMRLWAAGRGASAAALRSVVTVPPPQDTGTARRRERENRRLFSSRWPDERRGDGGPWAALGFDVVRWGSQDARWLSGALRRPAPVLARSSRVTAEGIPRLRWALKTATPPGPEAQRWGDMHFAKALADALERLGQQVSIDYRTTLRRASRHVDDVNLVLRGLLPVPYEVGATNLLWVISHPERVTDEELRTYDGVFAASITWAERETARLGRAVVPLLQATDPSRFRPDVADPDTGDSVLFVGNSRNVYRPVVRHLVEADHEVSVYGSRWTQFLPPGYLRADHVDNAELAALYRSAGVVLNDHWDDMREQGFLSNRLFDATAAGARVISDDVPDVDRLFGGLVRTFRDPGELRALVSSYGRAFPGEADRVAIAQRVRAEHSFDARARTLLDAALSLRD